MRASVIYHTVKPPTYAWQFVVNYKIVAKMTLVFNSYELAHYHIKYSVGSLALFMTGALGN